ncbi:DUF1302 domain-containing protein [Pseudomonas sp. 2FE]|uniref:DUF1302 domain-containing protein n=1 Tax=Pseudomonas sp. 2FE TaxID=2502190 RepID=UPI0010F801AE|nr:DUF1302 domain-containing protein [Pseudomonas sp. 2FE]
MRKQTVRLLTWGILAASHQAGAFQFDTEADGFSASLDNLVEYNAIYRTSETERIVRDGQNIFANANDGSEYYSRGLVANEYKLSSELHLKLHEDGLFVRGSAWYDTRLMDHNPTGGDNPLHNTDSDRRYPSDLENRVGHGTRLLDAYLYGNRELGGMPVNLRLGRQVINWGEGIYYGDGLNVVNPVDVGRLVLPSASLKEALLPTNMVALQLGLSDSLNLESFYGLEWQRNQLMPTGAFLSDNDIFGKGTNGVIIDLRSQLAELGVPEALVPGVNGVDGVVAGARYGRDRDASDNGQFGFALRYMAEQWNSTEFSLYYLNYHSKVPFLSLRPGSSFGCSAGDGGRFADLCGLAKVFDPTAVPLVDGLALLDGTDYDLIYPEDIRLFGFTVSGNVGDSNLALELTYRPNAPLEPSMTHELEQLASGALLGGGASGQPIDLGEFGTVDGRAIDLYRRHELYTGSLSAVHSFGPALGLDGLLLVAEVAANHVPGSLLDTANYQYLSSFSWGYTLNLSGSYENVWSGIDLLPGLTFRQDVYGTSPALNQNFIEGRKSSTLELGARYGENLGAKLSYTAFWGARKNNPLVDRDNLALNLSYSF